MLPSSVISRPGMMPSASVENTPRAMPTTAATIRTPAAFDGDEVADSDEVLVVGSLELGIGGLASRAHLDERTHVALEPAGRMDVQEACGPSDRHGKGMDLAASRHHQRSGRHPDPIAVDHELQLAPPPLALLPRAREA